MLTVGNLAVADQSLLTSMVLQDPVNVDLDPDEPGANPKERAEAVATPLEEAINGVEGIMYMKSVAGSGRSLQIIVTFLPSVDPDTAAVRVQNRASQALRRLPDRVRQYTGCVSMM
jgi:multidrug efflux pump